MIQLLSDVIAWIGEKAVIMLFKAILEGDRAKAARLATAAATKAARRRAKPR